MTGRRVASLRFRLSDLGRRVWFEVQGIAGGVPRLYLPFARWRFGAELPVGPTTEIVIEGFPRSANTFAVVAFEMAQGRPVIVAHHLHVPAQVIVGARGGLPVVVLLRHPDEAVSSLLLREPYVTTGQAYRRYIRFHSPLRPLRDALVVATFDQITNDFGSVIHRVNARFGTAFTPFVHSDENVRLCFQAIDALPRRRVLAPGQSRATATSRPVDERIHLKASVRDRLQDPRLARLRARAEVIYRELEGRASR